MCEGDSVQHVCTEGHKGHYQDGELLGWMGNVCCQQELDARVAIRCAFFSLSCK
jgi:hypothetical protein